MVNQINQKIVRKVLLFEASMKIPKCVRMMIYVISLFLIV